MWGSFWLELALLIQTWERPTRRPGLLLGPKGRWGTGRLSCRIPGEPGKDGSLGLQIRKCQEGIEVRPESGNYSPHGADRELWGILGQMTEWLFSLQISFKSVQEDPVTAKQYDQT